MKHEWRKHEKDLYLPLAKPIKIVVPPLKYYTIKGEGNPNSDAFAECIGALYAVSYGIKMSPKKGSGPEGYFDYTVYPLEGIWDINEEAKKNYKGVLDKDSLVYKLMIRQPDFVTIEFANTILEEVKKKKPNPLLNQLKFEAIEEGDCIQMLHKGSFDDEPGSFKMMEDLATSEGLKRKSKVHREIYLTDARRTAPDKLKTVLRFKTIANPS